MGTLIEKWFGFSQIREELEARISGLENENTELENRNDKLFAEKEYLAAETSGLKDANNQLRQKNDKLFTTKDKLTKVNAELKTEKENLNNQLNASQKQVKELEQSQQVLK
ncbi:transcriptional regulator, partial [Helicobacter pylori]